MPPRSATAPATARNTPPGCPRSVPHRPAATAPAPRPTNPDRPAAAIPAATPADAAQRRARADHSRSRRPRDQQRRDRGGDGHDHRAHDAPWRRRFIGRSAPAVPRRSPPVAAGSPAPPDRPAPHRATAPATPYAPANTPQLRAQSPTATTTFGAGHRFVGASQRLGHVAGHRPGHQQRVGMPRRGHQPGPVPLGVVDRTERRPDLHLAAVARPGIHVADLHRAGQLHRRPQHDRPPGARAPVRPPARPADLAPQTSAPGTNRLKKSQ